MRPQAIFPFVTEAFYQKINIYRLSCFFYASDPYDYCTIICWQMWEHATVTKIYFNANILIFSRSAADSKQ